ncbi:hypothetical protein UFOVP41_32 [uncultured Caudovirales phage]|uniref:Uncharacterized protein n=1 Tax=uncultured Caudovirales phage TaxID=2100421 RepID=A0A6J5KQR8_9CAUD|nr:hypothetical protein UFOVP41_32 [uncultured Caudovirales phage]
MKCIECKWFVCASNDQYGLCKRYPIAQNKTQQDWCGEFNAKVEIQKLEIKFEEPNQYEYDIHTDSVELKPKRGRKPKA